MAESITIEIPVSLIDQTEPGLSSITSKLKSLQKASDSVEKSMGKAGASSNGFLQNAEKSARTMRGFSGGAGKSFSKGLSSTVSIDARDNTGKAFSSVSTGLKGLKTQSENIGKSMEKSMTSITKSPLSRLKSYASGRIKSAVDGSPALQAFNAKAKGLASKAIDFTINAKDMASPVIQSCTTKAKGLASKGLTFTMKAKDMASPVISKVSEKAKGVASKVWTTTMKVKDMATSPIRKVIDLIKSPIAATGLTIGVTAGIATSVKAYANLTSTMSEVSAISGATGRDLDGLTQKAKDLGASTKFTAIEVAEGMKYMGMAGWNATQISGGISGVLDLAAASGEDLGRTSDIVTDALTAFNMKAEEAGHFADVLAVASSKSNTNVGMMGETFKYAGAMAGSLGYDVEDVGTAIGLMANRGIKASMAGTALNTIFTRLATNTSGAQDQLKALGIDFYDSTGKAKPFVTIMEKMRDATRGWSDQQKATFANSVAGMEAQKGLLAILNASDAEYDSLANAIDHADGAAKNMANTMLDNLGGKWTLFTSALDGVKTRLGERLSPYLMQGLEVATDMMPKLQMGIDSVMDHADDFVDNFKNKISTMTSSEEWQDSDIFGKMHIAWDTIIGDPLKKWWGSTGQGMMSDVAGDVGKALGTGLSAGILAIMGIDVSGVLNDGQSVGASFAKGFQTGFQGVDVTSALMKNAGKVMKSAGGIFSGGSNLSNLLSAMLVGRVGMKAIGGLMKGGSFLKGLGGLGGTGATGEAAAGAGAGATGGIMGSAAAGTGIKGLLATLGVTGAKLGSGAATGAGLIGAGAAGVGGGIAGLVSVLSGAVDAYKASKKTGKEAQVGRESAALKFGGAGAGAAIGASVGSVVPGIGTAVGALAGFGIGGIAGMIGGNKVKSDYEETAEAAKKASEESDLLKEKSKYALEGASFESDDLAKKFKDSSVSATAFAASMEEATNAKIKNSLGDISLSMSEIQDAARQIVFKGDTSGFDVYTASAKDAADSLQNLQDVTTSMKKLNWQAGLGEMNTEESVQSYKEGVNSMISSAQSYLDDSHYQATTSIGLLVDPDSSKNITDGLDSVYSDLQSQLSSASDDMDAQLKIALKDGSIDVDEQGVLEDYQSKITDITDKLSSAETEAGMQSLKVKYSGVELDQDSFNQLTTELQTQTQSAMDSYDDALKVSLTSLNLELDQGAISQDQYDEQVQQLTDGYHAKVQDLAVQVEGFQLNTIADAFGSELDNIAPGIEGTTSEKLGTVLNNALSSGVDVAHWDVGTASQWLNLDGMSAETASAVTQMLSTVAATMPASLTSALEGSGTPEALSNYVNNAFGNTDFTDAGSVLMNNMNAGLAEAGNVTTDVSSIGEGVKNNLMTSIDSTDFSDAGATVQNKVNEGMSNISVDASGGSVDASGMGSAIQSQIVSSLDGVDFTDAGSVLQSKISESMGGLSLGGDVGSVDASGMGEAIQGQVTGSLEGVDFTDAGSVLQSKLSESMGSMSVDGAAVDMSGLGEQISAGANAAVAGADFSGVTSTLGSGVSTAVLASFPQIQGAISSLYSQVAGAVNAAFSRGFQTSTTVTITANYRLANPTATISFSGGGTGSATVSGSISSHAAGTITTGPEIALIGEAGPEAVIPLSANRRGRGLELLQQVGEQMGVSMDTGGGDTGGDVSSFIPDTGYTTDTSGGNQNNVKVGSTNVNFDIKGADGDVMGQIRKNMDAIANGVSDRVAAALGNIFENTPT